MMVGIATHIDVTASLTVESSSSTLPTAAIPASTSPCLPPSACFSCPCAHSPSRARTPVPQMARSRRCAFRSHDDAPGPLLPPPLPAERPHCRSPAPPPRTVGVGRGGERPRRHRPPSQSLPFSRVRPCRQLMSVRVAMMPMRRVGHAYAHLRFSQISSVLMSPTLIDYRSREVAMGSGAS